MSNSTKTRFSFAEAMSKAEVMAAGLKTNLEQIKKRGLDEAFISEMERLHQEAVKLNNEQEKLKADLKLKTESLTQKLVKIEKKYAEAKKVVKMDFPQQQWVEFGIEDKR